MERLIEGYRRFRATRWRQERDRFSALAARGQAPRALVLTCVDSRVDPQLIFDARPGELFVVRNIASLVPPYAPDAACHGTSAAIEFGVRVLKVPDLVVMGHGQCGGVRALLEGTPPEARDFVPMWINIAEPARRRVAHLPPEERQRACEFEAVRLSLANLLGFPWVREPVEAGRLRLHGCYFAIATGQLWHLRPDDTFAAVESRSRAAAGGGGGA